MTAPVKSGRGKSEHPTLSQERKTRKAANGGQRKSGIEELSGKAGSGFAGEIALRAQREL